MVWQFRDADVGIRITDLFWWLAIASTFSVGDHAVLANCGLPR